MKYFVLVSIIISLGLAAKIVRAPEYQVKDKAEAEALSTIQNRISNSIDHPIPIIIDSIPNTTSTAGSAGKNIIFAEDGQNVAVIYGRQGSSPNEMILNVTYSTDLGNTWVRYPLGSQCWRVYSGLDAEQNWPVPTDLSIHFICSPRAITPDSTPCFYAKEMMYPDGIFTPPSQLPNSGRRDVSHPCIGVKDSFIIITATSRSYNDCYIWRWTGATFDTGRVFFPGPLEWMVGPHFRFGSDGYMFFLWNREVEGTYDRYWPYYCESFDYGLTWTQPQLIWQDNPPYLNMSNVTSWWYNYDCEVVRDTPVATVKFSTANLEYGEIWVYRPDSGTAGNWHFKGKKLVGGDSIAPQTYACYPTVAADDDGNTFIGFQAFYVVPPDSVARPDLGLFARPSIQDTWIDWGRITTNGSDLTERFLEFAHNAPLFANGDSSTVGMIFTTADSFPFSGNLYYHHFNLPNPPYYGIAENNKQTFIPTQVTVTPNPFRHQITFSYPKSNAVTLEIFDVTGRMIYRANSDGQSQSIIWQGRKSDGSRVNAGVYFYTISSGKNTYQGKIILTR